MSTRRDVDDITNADDQTQDTDAGDEDGYDDGYGDPREDKKYNVKAWHVIFLIVLVICTFLLAYWQWTRFQSGSGTFQNLGYAFQWPLFGLFFIYAYRMLVKYENQAAEARADSDDPDFLYEADLAEFGEDNAPVTEIDEEFLPQRPQLDVEEFNEINAPKRGYDSDTGLPQRRGKEETS